MNEEKESQDKNQTVLFDSKTITHTERKSPVWVVASKKMDSPHPYVEAVYFDENLAEKHKNKLIKNAFKHNVVAVSNFKCEVQENLNI